MPAPRPGKLVEGRFGSWLGRLAMPLLPMPPFELIGGRTPKPGSTLPPEPMLGRLPGWMGLVTMPGPSREPRLPFTPPLPMLGREPLPMFGRLGWLTLGERLMGLAGREILAP